MQKKLLIFQTATKLTIHAVKFQTEYLPEKNGDCHNLHLSIVALTTATKLLPILLTAGFAF